MDRGLGEARETDACDDWVLEAEYLDHFGPDNAADLGPSVPRRQTIGPIQLESGR
jgi:hypothetical protein